MSLADAPVAKDGFFVTHFLTVKDQKKSKAFYVGVLGGKVVKPENPCYIKLANSWIILNSGGGPTPDKPEVFLETSRDPNVVNSFLDLRVADIQACYKQWKARGGAFPHQAARQSRPRMPMLHAQSGRLHHRSGAVYAARDSGVRQVQRVSRQISGDL
jgi:hypothetical protein